MYLNKNRIMRIVRSLYALSVFFHCALHCARELCVIICAQRETVVRSLCAFIARSDVHNVNPAFLRNEAAQCKTVVRSAWHNGSARISGAISAWHNVFGIVRILFDGFFSYNTVQNFGTIAQGLGGRVFDLSVILTAVL